MHKRGLFRLLSIITTGLVLGIIAFLLFSRWNEITAFPWRFNLGPFLLVLAFHSLALGATFVGWHLMILRLAGFGDTRINFGIYYISTLAKRIPTSFPYLGSRLVMYHQEGVRRSAVMNGILLENLTIAVGGIITFTALLPFYSYTPKEITKPLFILGIALLGLMLIRPQVFIELSNLILGRLGKTHLKEAPDRKDFVLWLGIYIIPWYFAGLSLYFVPLAFTSNIHLSIIDAIEISTLATLVSMLSLVLPVSMGFKELMAATLLTKWMPFSSALLLSLVYRLIHSINEVGWAVIAYWIYQKEGNKLNSRSNRPNKDG